MKILMISPCPLFPTDQGNRIRIKRLIDIMREQNHQVYYLHVNKEGGDSKKEAEFISEERYFQIDFTYNETLTSKIRHYVKKITDRQWFFYIRNGLDDYCSKKTIDQVLELDNHYDFDVIWVEYVFLSKIFEYVPKHKLKVLDTHDLFTDRHKSYNQDKKKYRWYSISKADETKGVRRADCVIAIQQQEASIYRQMMLSTSKVVTIGHKEQVKALPVVQQHSILFLASGNQLNRIAIHNFIEQCYGKIKDKIPDVQLLIAGSIGQYVETTDESIVRLGFVDELEEAYKKANIVINPIVNGTGLKIKCVEALAFGRVLVTTKDGAEGLDSDHNRRFVVTDQVEEMAQAIIDLMDDEEKLKAYSQNAIDYVVALNESIDNKIETVLTKGTR